MQRYLTVKEAAERLSLSEAAVYMRIHRRTIPFVKTGKIVRFDPRRLEAMMEAGAQDVLVAR